MKFLINENLSLADLKTQTFKDVKKELKAYKLADFIKDISVHVFYTGYRGKKEILKIVKIEIIKNHGLIIPWVDLIAKDFDNYFEISCNFYNCAEYAVNVYSRQEKR